MRVGLLVLIGLPGSGKTTLAKNLTKNIEKIGGNICNFIHVCYDELISFPNGNYDMEWKSARNAVLVKIDNLVQAIKNKNVNFSSEFGDLLKSITHWESDFVIVIDDNMYFRSMRYSLFQIAKKQSISFCQVYLYCSVENALLNNSFRGSETVVPSHVITNMSSKIEPPNSKNNWEKYSIQLNGFCNLNEIQIKLFPLLNTSLNNYFFEKNDYDNESKEFCKIQCKRSVLHQSDIALRKIIGCKVKNYFCENPKEKSKDFITQLHLRKYELFSDIKAGNIYLPDEILKEINSDILEKLQLINFLESYF